MARPIDADAVLDRYYAEFEKQDICDGSQDRNWLMQCIDEAPTLTPQNEWVSVEERLPAPTENPVLVYDCTGVNMAWYSYAMGWTHRTGLPGVEITHWMPLPEPPEKE